ncbi:proline-rich receptor-like protein kinase PERK7 [Abrus precatorius]|uniref:Proline-rich receptor-like protein kinase PERK7 n=1 Tax=Abrus precatorius TaxID=3816 RepID=A0A8B8K849_ABRPR|nr:proline-rich receptor-like protein kinase PERK7 [Abrus precatorius]
MASLSGFATITIALLFAGSSAGRDLRPSEHGLVFQSSPPANSSVEMRSFFNSNKGSSSTDSPLRNITESLPPPWWRSSDGGGGGSHLGGALMMASLVCGITGGVLLVASALLYLFKHRRKHNQNDSFRAHSSNHTNNNTINNRNYNNNSANKLQLVPAVRNH